MDHLTYVFLAGVAIGMMLTWSHYEGRITWGHSWWDTLRDRLRGWR